VTHQADQHPRSDRVELADMTEAERPQERPQRGRCPDPGEQPTHRAVTQQRHVIDRVGPGDHPGNQARDLQVGVDPSGLGQLDMLPDQALQTGTFGQLQNRCQARTRHQVPIIEDGREAMAESHPADALLCGRISL